jgi:CO/xanthine dehydrogenase FAD-binding subunit
MVPFTYQRTADLQSAIAALAVDPEAACIAGGTELLNWSGSSPPIQSVSNQLSSCMH